MVLGYDHGCNFFNLRPRLDIRTFFSRRRERRQWSKHRPRRDKIFQIHNDYKVAHDSFPNSSSLQISLQTTTTADRFEISLQTTTTTIVDRFEVWRNDGFLLEFFYDSEVKNFQLRFWFFFHQARAIVVTLVAAIGLKEVMGGHALL
ncbi:uncharacterized protein LOC142618749 [Castanea sativa]|uniref:uncharacterized protein LOC142618749 n=1 Tax=Castanea sativa TaxID=21020 RepID=UPI003F650BAA